MTSNILTTTQGHPSNVSHGDDNRPAEPNIILAGGRDISEDLRLHQVEQFTDRVKLAVENRYEHFESTSDVRNVDGRALRVYAWIYRTYVAE